MNYPDPTCPWCYPYPDNAGDAAAEENNGNNSVVDLFRDYITDDLFELVCRGGGGGTLEQEEPAVSCVRLSPLFMPPPPSDTHVPEVPIGPPSEDEMATWLYGIVKGQEEHDHRGGDCRWTDNIDGRHAPLESTMETKATTSRQKNEKFRTSDGGTVTKATQSSISSRTRNKTAETRRSNHGVTHKLTEKRRRCKINERLKTLQHLVPGCDNKANYTSTLEKTIQYVKSLQQQVQVLAAGAASHPAVAAAALHPVAGHGQPQYIPPPGPPVTTLGPMVPVLPLPHYPSLVVMMPAAAVTPLYAATPVPRFAPPPVGEAGQGSCSSTRGKE